MRSSKFLLSCSHAFMFPCSHAPMLPCSHAPKRTCQHCLHHSTAPSDKSTLTLGTHSQGEETHRRRQICNGIDCPIDLVVSAQTCQHSQIHRLYSVYCRGTRQVCGTITTLPKLPYSVQALGSAPGAENSPIGAWPSAWELGPRHRLSFAGFAGFANEY